MVNKFSISCTAFLEQATKEVSCITTTMSRISGNAQALNDINIEVRGIAYAYAFSAMFRRVIFVGFSMYMLHKVVSYHSSLEFGDQ